MSTGDRKAELERKKAKLEAMRAEKKRADEEKKKGVASSGVVSSASTGAIRTDADDILKEMGIVVPSPSDQQIHHEPSESDLSVASGMGGGNEPAASPKHHKVMLGVSKVTQTNIPPKELVHYSKETQTTATSEVAEGNSLLDDAEDIAEVAEPASKQMQVEEVPKEEAPVEKPPPKVLTEDECKQVCIFLPDSSLTYMKEIGLSFVTLINQMTSHLYYDIVD